jgi:hypothetical protein
VRVANVDYKLPVWVQYPLLLEGKEMEIIDQIAKGRLTSGTSASLCLDHLEMGTFSCGAAAPGWWAFRINRPNIAVEA